MIDFIEGTVAEVTQHQVILVAGGIGYALTTDTRTRASVQCGERARLYAQLRIADDRAVLYGFSSRAQKDMFAKLTSVSGIGPRLALAVLSSLSVSEIAAAVLSSDEKVFQAVSGVGKKTASRLILDLKEQVSASDLEDPLAYPGPELVASGESKAAAEAADALEGLGYSRMEAMRAVASVRSLGDSAEDLVKLALKRLGMQ